eukprot:326417-Chlamydomonas_euryale.AAC.3
MGWRKSACMRRGVGDHVGGERVGWDAQLGGEFTRVGALKILDVCLEKFDFKTIVINLHYLNTRVSTFYEVANRTISSA